MPIRRAQPGDVPALVALEQGFAGDRLSARSFRRFIGGDRADVWVYVERDVILGDAVVLYRRGSATARLYSLVVAAAARGRGLGRALLQGAEQQAAQRGATALRLEVRPENSAAIALYRRAGYVDAGVIAAFYEDGAPARRLQKTLRPSLSGRARRPRGPRLAIARP